MLLSEPPRTQLDLDFRLFGVPVRVHPLFWLTGVFLNLRSPDLYDMAIWLAAVFVSILMHEMGHAAAVRASGADPAITLHAFGGITAYDPSPGYGRRWSRWAKIKVAAAGPVAGFLLAAAVVLSIRLAGHALERQGPGGLVLMPPLGTWPAWFETWIWYLQVTSVYWGIMNLLPIFPLDGGQIARELLLAANPRDGVRQSLVLSIVAAVGLCAVVWLQWQDWWLALFFLLLAYESYSALQSYGARGPW